MKEGELSIVGYEMDEDENLRRIETLAYYVVRTWPNETSSQLLRHAMRLNRGTMNPTMVREAIAKMRKP